MNINYESDFKIVEGFKDGTSILAAPFKFTYYTKVTKGVYVAEYNGSEFINCHPTDDGRVVVPFDSHKLGMGVLMVKREFFLNDKDFAYGICNLVSVESTGITLDKGATDMDGEVNIELFPFYQRGLEGKSAYQEWLDLGNEGTTADFIASLRGADGKPFTYGDMTDEEKEDLASHINIEDNSITENKLSQEVRTKLNKVGDIADGSISTAKIKNGAVTEDKLSDEVKEKINTNGGGGYKPPVGGIPRTDLSQEVQASLRKADTALQEHQSLVEYAKKSELPTKTSQLTNDSGFVTEDELSAAIAAAITNELNSEV